jgi:hypothetical protein
MHSGKVEHSPLKEMLILMLTFSKITMGADKEDTEMLQDFSHFDKQHASKKSMRLHGKNMDLVILVREKF